MKQAHKALCVEKTAETFIVTNISCLESICLLYCGIGHSINIKMNWSKAHPEGCIPDREAGWKEAVEQDVYLWLLGHSAAVISSCTGTQRCQALRCQHLKYTVWEVSHHLYG